MGLTFLFSAALWALPLALLPVILHLLFRRKSPVIFFSTLRFIKASVQKTAARKRVQKWLLLSVRILLLAILIAAVAQPARRLGTAWASPGKASIACIVVDTSYSMQLQEHQAPLLSRADAAVRELLRDQLANARVALFRSSPAASGEPEQLHDAGELLAQWTPLTVQPNPRPLVDRIALAADLLQREHADDRWLVVVSDFQKREFPSQIPQIKNARVVLIDLHPEDPRSAGITRVTIDPAQPTPGIGSEVVVDISGRRDTSRAVAVSVTTPGGDKHLLEAGVQVARFNSSGHARMRYPIRLPAERWMMLNASFQDDDDMTWDNSRGQLIETPPKQIVSFLGDPASSTMARSVWLALDPSEGSRPEGWSLQLKKGLDIAPDANVAVLLVEDWPDDARTARLLSFVKAGGTAILFLRPGLEETWERLPTNRKAELKLLLPSEPVLTRVATVSTVAVAAPQDALLNGFSDERFQVTGVVVRRLVPFSVDPQAKLLLNCFPREPRPEFRPAGLLYRRPCGAGQVYTLATLPDRKYTNLELHPLFLPLMVRMAQRSTGQSEAKNIELGQSLSSSGREFEEFSSLTVQGPRSDTTVVKADRSSGTAVFNLGNSTAPGIYTWLKPNSNEVFAISNVQLPAEESELVYISAKSVIQPGDNVLISRSIADLHAQVSNLGEPEPKWTLPIAIVLLMLCAEALMSSLSRVWIPFHVRGFMSNAASARQAATTLRFKM